MTFRTSPTGQARVPLRRFRSFSPGPLSSGASRIPVTGEIFSYHASRRAATIWPRKRGSRTRPRAIARNDHGVLRIAVSSLPRPTVVLPQHTSHFRRTEPRHWRSTTGEASLRNTSRRPLVYLATDSPIGKPGARVAGRGLEDGSADEALLMVAAPTVSSDGSRASRSAVQRIFRLPRRSRSSPSHGCAYVS